MKLGWKCPITGEPYAADDSRLIGRGNPPTIPLAPGMGNCQMQPALIDDGVAPVADKTFAESYTADAIAKAQPVQ